MPSVSDNTSCVTCLSEYQVTANAKLCIGQSQLQCQLYVLHKMQSGGKKAQKRGRKASGKGGLESKRLDRGRKRVAEGKEGSRGEKGCV